ncbi:MAG: hypothetical protein ABR981_03660 [Candidatus Micrarchaeaceae archaeon]|jgi:hypothetical protein
MQKEAKRKQGPLESIKTHLRKNALEVVLIAVVGSGVIAVIAHDVKKEINRVDRFEIAMQQKNTPEVQRIVLEMIDNGQIGNGLKYAKIYGNQEVIKAAEEAAKEQKEKGLEYPKNQNIE